VKITIEIEKDEDIKKIRKAFKGEHITVVKTRKEKNKILEAVFKKYNVKLPKNYRFDREQIQQQHHRQKGAPSPITKKAATGQQNNFGNPQEFCLTEKSKKQTRSRT